MLVGAFALGVVPYREVTGSRGPAAREAMLNDMSAWSRSVGLVGVGASELTVSVKSDIEGVVRNLAQSFADGLTAGAIEVVDAPVGRHAVVAERAVRTIKESANTLCAGLEQSRFGAVRERGDVPSDALRPGLQPLPGASWICAVARAEVPEDHTRTACRIRVGSRCACYSSSFFA